MSPEGAPVAAHVYRLELRLWEHVFFASREVSEFFQTEPVIGNYALTYALGLAQSPYRVEVEGRTQLVTYKRDLMPLNARGVYVTPATIVGEPKFALTQFNAQTDTYWSVFTKNTIAVRFDDKVTRKEGSDWYVIDPATGKKTKVRPSNFPQHGRIKMLARDNIAIAYILSRDPLDAPPPYIRLGKFMSKTAVFVSHHVSEPKQRDGEHIPVYLNAVDLPDPGTLTAYDLLSIHPAPLVRNAQMSGWFYRAPDGAWLPAGMRFGVESLP